MADKWSVEPSEGVIQINDGIFQFPANETAEPIEYVVTYFSDVCNCTCTKTVVVEPGLCECTVTSKTSAVSSEAGNYQVGSISIVGACGEITWEHDSGENFASNFTIDDNGKIYADIAANDSDARQGKYKASCGGELTIKQAAHDACMIDWNSEECVMCDCGENDFELLETSITVPGNGVSNKPIATMNVCVGDITHDDGWECTFGGSETSLTITVPTNPGGERSEAIKFRYFDRCGNELGQKTLSLTQEIACPASGDVVSILNSNPILGCASSYGGYFAFKDANPEFSSVASIEGDGTVVLGGFFNGTYQQVGHPLVVTLTKNDTGAQRTGTLTITMNTAGGGQCAYDIPVTQKVFSNSDCTSTTQIMYTNNTGYKIESGTGHCYDSSGTEIGIFKIDTIENGVQLGYSVFNGDPIIGKTVASITADLYIKVGTESVRTCRVCDGDIINKKIEANRTYNTSITSTEC